MINTILNEKKKLRLLNICTKLEFIKNKIVAKNKDLNIDNIDPAIKQFNSMVANFEYGHEHISYNIYLINKCVDNLFYSSEKEVKASIPTIKRLIGEMVDILKKDYKGDDKKNEIISICKSMNYFIVEQNKRSSETHHLLYEEMAPVINEFQIFFEGIKHIFTDEKYHRQTLLNILKYQVHKIDSPEIKHLHM